MCVGVWGAVLREMLTLCPGEPRGCVFFSLSLSPHPSNATCRVRSSLSHNRTSGHSPPRRTLSATQTGVERWHLRVATEREGVALTAARLAGAKVALQEVAGLRSLVPPFEPEPDADEAAEGIRNV